MTFSRSGFLAFLISLTVLTSGCGQINQVLARKDLVDGATAYQDRKFDLAEQLFRKAVSRDPNLETAQGRTAQVYLARTLHSQFINDRKNTAKAQEAMSEYKKALGLNIEDQSSFKAVANLYETLDQRDQWQEWMNGRASNEKVPPSMRAEVFTLLAAKKYSCANEISDVEPVKKTVTEGGKSVFKFTKPAAAEEFEKLKSCTQEGMDLIDKAVQLQAQAKAETDSTWSYKANLLIQKMRIAEMEGNTADKDRFKKESEVASARFSELSEARRKKEEEEAAKKAAEEAKTPGAPKK